MCQHVRGRRAGSSQRGDRQTRVPLRVPGYGPPQLRDVFVVVDVDDDNDDDAGPVLSPQWLDGHLDKYKHDDDDQQPDGDQHVDEGQQRRRGRGRRGRGSVSWPEAPISENAHEISQPWRRPGGLHDRMAGDARVLLGPVDDVERDDHGSPVGAEEARSPESLQSGSGGGCARPVRNGTQPCRLQNGLHPAARSQGGRQQTAHCRQDAFLSRSFAPGVQVHARRRLCDLSRQHRASGTVSGERARRFGVLRHLFPLETVSRIRSTQNGKLKTRISPRFC